MSASRNCSVAPPCRLALEDGSVFHGVGFGAVDRNNRHAGEVVFNTAMVGYQEALTDPSYAGQILVMTAPMIGNYGVNEEDVESARVQVSGFVIRELSRITSNQRATTDLSSWLAQAGIPGIAGIDTRALVRRLRTKGAMRGVISCDGSPTDADLVEFARSSPEMTGRNLAQEVTPDAPGEWNAGLGEWRIAGDPVLTVTRPLRVLAIDCGAKRNIYRNLAERGCTVEFVPYDITPVDIRSRQPDGLFISNGPGDPDAVARTVETLREVAGEIPTFGICLGHQLLALALGARTYKLKFGHRGANQPVRYLITGRIEITSQNHGFCVESEGLEELGLEATHIHLNDGTVAGFRHVSKPIMAVQFHPEASPGPHDSRYLFDAFVQMMVTGQPQHRDPAAV